MAEIIPEGQPLEPPREAVDYSDWRPSFGQTVETLYKQAVPENPFANAMRRQALSPEAPISPEERQQFEHPSTEFGIGFTAAPDVSEPPQPIPQGPGRQDQEMLPADEINRHLAGGVTVTDKPLPIDVAVELVKQQKRKYDQDLKLGKYADANPWGFYPTAALVGLLSPPNAAAMLIPGVGEEFAASQLARVLGPTAAKVGGRMVAGGATMAAGGLPFAIMKPPEDAADWSLYDNLKQLAAMSAIAAVLHTGFGALKDRFAARPLAPMPEMRPEETVEPTEAGGPAVELPPPNLEPPPAAEPAPPSSPRINDEVREILAANPEKNMGATEAAVSQLAEGAPIEVSPILAPNLAALDAKIASIRDEIARVGNVIPGFTERAEADLRRYEVERAALVDRHPIPVGGEVVGPGAMFADPSHLPSVDEIGQMITDKEAQDHARLVQVLGSEERAKRFETLERRMNSSNPERADQAEVEFRREFGDLTEEQDKILGGVGEVGYQAEDLRELRDAVGATEIIPGDQYAVSDAADQVTEGLRQLGRRDRAKDIFGSLRGDHGASAQAAAIRFVRGFEVLRRELSDKAAVDRELLAAFQRAGFKPGDAEEMLASYMSDIAASRRPPPPTVPEIAAEQQQLYREGFVQGVPQQELRAADEAIYGQKAEEGAAAHVEQPPEPVPLPPPDMEIVPAAIPDETAPLRVTSAADIEPSRKVMLPTLYRGVEGGRDAISTLRVSKGGDLGDGIYTTQHEWLAKTYGGGPGASVRAGTRVVYQYRLKAPLFPEEVAYGFGGLYGGEEFTLVTGNGIEIYRGPWDAGNEHADSGIERALAANDIKLVIGTPESVTLNQIAVRDPSILEVVTAPTKEVAAKPARPAGQRAPQTLAEFLAAKGGMKDFQDELKTIGATEWHKGKLFQKRLVKADGMDIDAARELAEEAGYLPRGSTVNDLLDAVREEIGGNLRYREADRSDVQALAERRELLAEIDRMGEDANNWSDEQIHEFLSAHAEAADLDFAQTALDEEIGRQESDLLAGLEDRTIADELPFEPIGEAGGGRQSVEGAVVEPGRPGAAPEAAPTGPEGAARQGAGAQVPAVEGAQTVIPGAERITERAQAEREMAKPMRPGKPQKAADEGLFDVAGRGQTDLVDLVQAQQAFDQMAIDPAKLSEAERAELQRSEQGLKDAQDSLQQLSNAAQCLKEAGA